MKMYYKSQTSFEKAVKMYNSYGYYVDRKRVNCKCGESIGAYVYEDGTRHPSKNLQVMVVCECCYLQSISGSST